MRPDPRNMHFGSPEFSPPKPERRTLSNGMTVFLLEDHEIPLFQGSAVVRTGAVFDPPGKTGLARICGQLLVQGGTADFPGGLLDEILEDKAIDMESSIGNQSGSVSVNAMTENLDDALRLFADVLRRPAFDEGKLELARRKAIEEIVRTADDPDSLAFREFRRLLYAGDPRGRSATVEEVKGITRQDLVDFHSRSFYPDRVILGFSGDFDSTAVVEKLEKLFGDWTPSGEPAPPLPVPDGAAADRHINLIEKDLPQATMAMGHLAPSKTSPDYVPFMLADFILGQGGFNSRLTREVRSNRGLAYSVGSFYRGDIGYGVFVASGKTANSTAVEVLNVMAGIIEEMRTLGVTQEETAWAKDSIINGMIFRYSSSAAVLGEAMALEYDRLPPDFAERVKERIQKATAAEASNAARKWLNFGAATVVVLGKEAEYKGDWPPDRTLQRFTVDSEGRVR